MTHISFIIGNLISKSFFYYGIFFGFSEIIHRHGFKLDYGKKESPHAVYHSCNVIGYPSGLPCSYSGKSSICEIICKKYQPAWKSIYKVSPNDYRPPCFFNIGGGYC